MISWFHDDTTSEVFGWFSAVHLHVGEVIEVFDLLRRLRRVGADEHDARRAFADGLERLPAHVAHGAPVVLESDDRPCRQTREGTIWGQFDSTYRL